MIKTSKIVAAVVGLSMIVTAVVGVQSASAQAMSLSDLVNLFISLGIIAPDKAAAAQAAVTNSASSSVTFTRDLTIGSSGADVSALQAKLGVTPASGYFGSLTKAAVVSYQTANGIPGTGYVGSLTRAKLNAGSTVVTTTPTTPVVTPVVNTGVEGTITVSKASVSNTTVYEGDSMKSVLGIKVEAKLSDINVQRVKVSLGTLSSIYTKIFKTMYVTDASGAVLAQAELNSNTVTKDGGTYYLTLGGFNYVVAKDSTKTLYVKADLYSSIDSTDLTSRTVTLIANGVRGVDGAGIDQYGPVSAFSQSVTPTGSLVDSATLKVSTNSANYKANEVIAADGSNEDELDGLALLAFDVKAEKDTVTITDIAFAITDTAGQSTTTTAYLYEGSTLIASESVTGATVTFSDIDYSVAAGVTKTLVVKVDVRDATATANSLSIATGTVTAENSQGDAVTPSGSASGETMVIRNVGPQFALVGTPAMTKGETPAQGNYSTSTASATFNIKIKAVGGDLYFGTQAASTTFAFNTYQGGAATTLLVASSTSWSVPSSGVVTSGLPATVAFQLQENNEVTIPVTFLFEGRTADGALVTSQSYATGVSGITWATTTSSTNTSTFMSGKTDWRATPAVSLP